MEATPNAKSAPPGISATAEEKSVRRSQQLILPDHPRWIKEGSSRVVLIPWDDRTRRDNPLGVRPSFLRRSRIDHSRVGHGLGLTDEDLFDLATNSHRHPNERPGSRFGEFATLR